MNKHLFTIIADYRGGTYISQITEKNPLRAMFAWTEQLNVTNIEGFGKKTKKIIKEELESEDLVQISETLNIWIFGCFIKKKYLNIHIIKTAQ